MRRTLPLLLLSLAACAPAGGPAPASAPRTPVSTVVQTPVSGNLQLEVWSDAEVVAETTLAGTPESLWPRLAEAFAELGLEANGVDSEARAMGLQHVRVRRIGGRRLSQYIDCGTGPLGNFADSYQVYLTLVTRLDPAPGGATHLRTHVDAQARDGLRSSAPTECRSNGRLERELAEALQRRAAAAG